MNGGVEIQNGERRFNRPLYSSVDRPERLIAMAGDRPEFMVMRITGTKSMDKLANLKLGLADGPWLDEVAPVRTRYDKGVQQHEIGAGKNAVMVDAVRGMSFEGLLLRVRCAGKPSAPLVVMIGGRANANYDQNPKSAFNPAECANSQVTFAGNTLTIAGAGPTLHAVSPTPLRFTAAEPKAVAKGPAALLAALVKGASVGALTLEWPSDGEIHLMLTTDEPAAAPVAASLRSPRETFDRAVEENRALATAVGIDTPDPWLNAAMPGALLGYNAAWNAPSFRHGAIAWHDTYAGWRVTYGATVAGWHDRAQSHAKAFYDIQHKDGRIPATLRKDEIYNMGEVLVDQALYDYDWTGDLTPLQNGGFDAIARHLQWGDQFMKTPDGLYENFLNAWNTDYKWHNGGGGAIATAYFWRANKTMAEIAGRLGRDPAVFKARAEAIAAAMRARLWSERVGVFGEYRDVTGLKLLHESPDLSSIYTPVDVGFCTPFEAYRSLRFALRRFETVTGLPRDAALIYSSEWLPNHYSTRDIFTGEILNTLLALYRIGQGDAAEPFRRAIDGSYFTGPAPGSTGYVIGRDGVHRPHTDFTDTTSMYVRNVVDGLFGLQVFAPGNRVVVQPSFPSDWKHASIRCPAAAYEYTLDGANERLVLKTPVARAATIRLRARSAEIRKVTANGTPVEHTVEPGIGCAWVVLNLPATMESQVVVEYGAESLPTISGPATGAPGAACTVRIDRGRIEGVRTTKGGVGDAKISTDGRECVLPLPAEPGTPTFFVAVRHKDARLWLPVEVDVRDATPAASASSVEPAGSDRPCPSSATSASPTCTATATPPASPRSRGRSATGSAPCRPTAGAGGSATWSRSGTPPRWRPRRGGLCRITEFPSTCPRRGRTRCSPRATPTSRTASKSRSTSAPARSACFLRPRSPSCKAAWRTGGSRSCSRTGPSARWRCATPENPIDDFVGSGYGTPYLEKATKSPPAAGSQHPRGPAGDRPRRHEGRAIAHPGNLYQRDPDRAAGDHGDAGRRCPQVGEEFR
ncbi:MAG: hypothetical protein U1F77_10880 [Kiritimatiellia bacterium]